MRGKFNINFNFLIKKSIKAINRILEIWLLLPFPFSLTNFLKVLPFILDITTEVKKFAQLEYSISKFSLKL